MDRFYVQLDKEGYYIFFNPEFDIKGTESLPENEEFKKDIKKVFTEVTRVKQIEWIKSKKDEKNFENNLRTEIQETLKQQLSKKWSVVFNELKFNFFHMQ